MKRGSRGRKRNDVDTRNPRATTGASWFERFLLALFLVSLVLFAWDYMLGGAQGAGYMWYKTRRQVLEFLAWRIHVYVWILVPAVAVLTWLLRAALPVIEIPVISQAEVEAKWIKKWYRPWSLRVEDDQWTWREGRYRAYVNRNHLSRRGLLGLAVTVPVERNKNEAELEITYDTVDIPAYASRTLNRRLQREIQERVVQDHRLIREAWK